jgi:hypothetical protein
MRYVLAILAIAAVALAPSAAAQGEEMPTQLWSEFPLVQEVERTGTPSVGPFLPPSDSGTAPVSDDPAPWGLWALAAAAGLAALLVATRLARPAPVTRPRERDAPVQLRPHPHRLPRPAGPRRPLAQYAPSPSLVLADAPEEPWRSVVRRTGLLRSRYVVLEGQSPDEREPVATSKSFWNVGGSGMRERVAEDAWDDLMNDLRASGWEPEPTRRSDFYVLLQHVEPVEPEEPSIVTTLDAYGGVGDPDDADDA